jgi:S1-C subfamily serine protease
MASRPPRREWLRAKQERPEVVWVFLAGLGVGAVAIAFLIVVPLMSSRQEVEVSAKLPASIQTTRRTFELPSLAEVDRSASAAPDRANIVAFIEPSVVRIDTVNGFASGGFGSGFFIHESGIAVTNYHVIKGARRGIVTFSDKTELPIERFLTLSELKDLALIKVDLQGRRINAVPLASANPRKGEDVMAIGTPQGFDFSVSTGIVSAVRSDAESQSMRLPRVNVIQHTTPLSPGNSGGPLFNNRGEVVGINTSVWREENSQNINFAVSVLELRALIDKAP